MTFGELSVGNNLVNSIVSGCQHIRYVNGNDPVTKIVPNFVFKHYGILKEIVDVDSADMRFDHSHHMQKFLDQRGMIR